MTTAAITQKNPFEVELEAGETYYYCSCGLSENGSFCDGNHKGTDFKPIAFTPEESKTAYICGCRRNDGSPFCNGAHKDL